MGVFAAAPSKCDGAKRVREAPRETRCGGGDGGGGGGSAARDVTAAPRPSTTPVIVIVATGKTREIRLGVVGNACPGVVS